MVDMADCCSRWNSYRHAVLLYIIENYKAKVISYYITTICFVGFYSVPNLIVIIFNLLYPVCIVGFHYKGCVIERVV